MSISSSDKLPSLTMISGGQTGVDRAALDAAMSLNIPVGGWCPKGRRAEDGPIPDSYPLTETKCNKYRTRTRWNVRDSDATLILCEGEPTGGTLLTVQFCIQLNRPFLVVSPSSDLQPVFAWIDTHQIKVLNVAGPRERDDMPVYQVANVFLTQLFRFMANQAFSRD